jgi:hypothetical protein
MLFVRKELLRKMEAKVEAHRGKATDIKQETPG